MEKTIVNKNFSKVLKTSLNILRNSELFCDFVLKTKNNEFTNKDISYPVHKFVLWSTCPFFKTYFTTSFNNNQDLFEFDSISNDVLEKIIDYIYTGEVAILQEIPKLKKIIDISLFLGIDSLVNSCTELLIECINIKTCCDLLEYSKSYHLADYLTYKCCDFLFNCEVEFKEISNFLNISYETILDLVSKERIENDSNLEKLLYNAIDDWISFDLSTRREFAPQLLDKIHYERLQEDFAIMRIFNKQNSHDLMLTAQSLKLNNLARVSKQVFIETVNSKNCCEILQKYYEIHNENRDIANKCYEFILEHIQTYKEIQNILKMPFKCILELVSIKQNSIQLCEESFYLLISEWICFNFDQRQQYIYQLLDKINFKYLSSDFYATKVINQDNPLKQSKYFVDKIFDINNRSLRMLTKYGINDPAHVISNVSLTCAIFGSELWKFDWEKQIFTQKITNLDQYLSGSTIFKNSNLFISGKGKNTDICQYFSFEKDGEWHDLPSMHEKRYHHRSIYLNDKIYVCGGDNLKSTEIFDLNTNCWNDGASFEKVMSSFGLCAYNGCLYAVNYNNFQRLDPRENIWTTLPNIPTNENYNHAAIGCDNFIYRFYSKGASKFDIRNNKWGDEITHIKKFTQVPYAILRNNKMHVIGKTDNKEFLLQTYSTKDFTTKGSIFIDFDMVESVFGLFHLEF